MNYQSTSRRLLSIGACWDSYSRKGDYRVHPDASYPHQKSILNFLSLREVNEWITMIKKCRAASTGAEAQEIYDEWKYQ